MQAHFDAQQRQRSKLTELGLGLSIDIVAALATSAVVAPFVAIIDRSIISNASGRMPLMAGLQDGFRTLATRPAVLARQPSVVAVFSVYAITYITANASETIALSANADPLLPKFLASSTVNIAACVYKDKLLTHWCSLGPARPFPMASYGLFGLRDSLTVAASFSLPPLLSTMLQSNTSMSKTSCDSISQLALPCMVQFISTPIHLLGLDIYNNPSATAVRRAQVVRRDFIPSTLARMGRILPAFGFGGLVNNKTRTTLKRWIL
ncbi:hypothetical protein CcCBS67573_g00691 [Chytriomyces confervae]|uniref:Sequence orphan n=1 Tax=Chytriomyces confervae TaxID=246404 RepID=A0A507FQV1_9FUNG|nr:hypothetical protein HDU80_008454 [Chytriomyces hyalinus]TPX78080.1 hypothetical protein CcCBS67573_g00691 [Chytriomyces confervae]